MLPVRVVSLSFFLLVQFASAASAQRLAVLTPDDSERSKIFASQLEAAVQSRVKIIDDSLAKAAFESVALSSPYNLTLYEARHIGQSIGCDFFLLMRSDVQRRSSFERQEFYDAYAFVFLVSTRSGRLIAQPYASQIGATPDQALRKLLATIPATADAIVGAMRSTAKAELTEKSPPPMDEPPEEGSPEGRDFKAPVPFRRLKPEYTALADLYGVTATVDITIDLDANGQVLRTEIARWAGYGLDGSVDNAVRSMNWRPAERKGKFIPMRILVRYNFVKPEKQAKP